MSGVNFSIPPLGVFDKHLSTGKKTASAWVNFNGSGVVSIRDSFNVSSITDNGIGDFTVNFAANMSNALYSAVATVSSGPNAGGDGVASLPYGTYAVSGFDMKSTQIGGTAANRFDPVYASAVVFGGN